MNTKVNLVYQKECIPLYLLYRYHLMKVKIIFKETSANILYPTILNKNNIINSETFGEKVMY